MAHAAEESESEVVCPERKCIICATHGKMQCREQCEGVDGDGEMGRKMVGCDMREGRGKDAVEGGGWEEMINEDKMHKNPKV